MNQYTTRRHLDHYWLLTVGSPLLLTIAGLSTDCSQAELENPRYGSYQIHFTNIVEPGKGEAHYSLFTILYSLLTIGSSLSGAAHYSPFTNHYSLFTIGCCSLLTGAGNKKTMLVLTPYSHSVRL